MLTPLTICDVNGNPLRAGLLVPTYEKFASVYMRGKFGLKKFQRGILQLATGGTMIAAGGGGVTPLVSDIFIEHSQGSGVVNAGIVFNYTTGGFGNHELVKRHSTNRFLMGDDDAGSPVDHTGEWTAAAVTGADWQVACTSEDSGTWDVAHAAVGVYSLFSTANMDWHENRPGGKGYTPGTDQCTATFRIREVADTGNNDDFEVIARAVQT